MFKNKSKKISVIALSALMLLSVGVTAFSACALSDKGETANQTQTTNKFVDVTSSVSRESLFLENYNADVVKMNNLSASGTYTAIVTLEGNSLSEEAAGNGQLVEDYLENFSALTVRNSIHADINSFETALKRKGIEATVLYSYDTLTKGVAVRAAGKQLNAIAQMDGVESVVVSEHYDVPDALEISNDTNVYTTGIYNTSEISSDLRGNGMVIAVVDTGMDVKHAAFQEDNFYATEFSITAEDIEAKLPYLKATEMDSTASTETLYQSSKLPFVFDYADKDTNVFPSYSAHGVHVAGIIAGNHTYVDQETVDSDEDLKFETDENGDYYFEGVVPDAQIVVIKAFTDNVDAEGLGGAETEDILAGLEDAVTLGVDVINMSLGSSGGFSEYASDYMEIVYDRIEEAGISLICAAGNEYSSGYGGPNGTNLTSNPDSATVGSPSTYPASFSVASINGQKDPYMLANDETMVFFTEATDGNSNKMDFISDIFDRLKSTGYMAQDATHAELQYVVIPGLGRSYNYSASIVQKLNAQPSIAVVQRGTTTFEEKMKIAMENGAIGIIICNNVAGKINMTMGAKDHSELIPSCSTTMDIGTQLISNAVNSVGTIVLDQSYLSGPFMSDFSSWGPSPSLELKPEITSYGGNVTSAVANGYDVYSGTSMATPNVAGAITIIRQFLKQQYPEMSNTEIVNRAYQLMMSTADIVINEYGNPYSPRKQGAGIADIEACLNSQSYLYVKDADGNVSSRTKAELGDDSEKTGVYEFTFYAENTSSSYAQYNIIPYIMTETVSSDGKTVAEKSYMLDDAIFNVWINGVSSKNRVITLNAGATAEIRVQIKLSDADKAYLDNNFKNGMYVEGFVSLKQLSSGIAGAELRDLSIPFLAFYGDWTDAIMMDYSAFEIAENQADDSIPDDEKLEVQFFSTQPYSKYKEEYIFPMGTYLYKMSDDMETIYASEDKAAVSMYNSPDKYTSYEFYAVYLGLMRGMATYEAYIVNEYTGEVVWVAADSKNLAKGYANGGSTRPGYLKVEFNPYELNLSNNTKYHFYMVGYLDYGDGQQGNKNSFDFTFYTDYETPTLVDYQLRFEEYVDSNEKTQTRVYLDVTTYDNHYTQALLLCYVDDDNELALLTDYVVPVYADSVGQTVTTSIEITDYYKDYYDKMYLEVEDYAMNFTTYSLDFANAIVFPETIGFAEEELNVVLYSAVKPTLVYTPSNAQRYDLLWESSDTSVAVVKDGEIYGVGAGVAYVTVYASNSSYSGVPSARIKVTVTDNNSTQLIKYTGISFELITNKNGTVVDPTNKTVEVHPNTDIQLNVKSEPWYFPAMSVVWSSSNELIATVDQNGLVHTLKEGSCTIMARQVDANGNIGLYSASVFLSVGPEYVITSYILTEYHGAGGDVVVPDEINFMYIDEECFMGDTTITSIVIPEDVIQIYEKAFYGCTSLKYVKFPKSLTMVEESAFEGCTALETIDLTDTLSTIFSHRCFYGDSALKEIIHGEHLTAVWNYTFAGCTALENLDLSNLMQAGTYSFANCTGLKNITFSEYTVVGEGMFFGCTGLTKISLPCSQVGKNSFYACSNLLEVELTGKVKIAEGAFRSCTSLNKVYMSGNVYSIGDRAFEGCTALTILVLPDNYVQIGSDAFYRCNGLLTVGIQQNTLFSLGESFRECANWQNIAIVTMTKTEAGYSIEVNSDITETENYKVENNLVYSKDGTELLLAPVGITEVALSEGLIRIGDGIFYGKKALTSVTLPESLESIGDYAFAYSGITSLTVPANVSEMGVGTFSYCYSLNNVTFAEGSKLTYIPEGCFNSVFGLTSLALPASVTGIGAYAFGATGLSSIYVQGGKLTAGLLNGSGLSITTLGEGAFSNTRFVEADLPATLQVMGDSVFALCSLLESVTFNSPAEIGDYTFFESNLLESVTFAEGMTSIGNFTFASIVGNIMLSEVVLPSTVTSIGNYVFYECQALTSVNLSNIESIGEYAFYGCSLLEEAELSNVVYIGESAFTGTTSLRTVNLERTVYIGDYAFYQSGIRSINIPVVEEIGTGGIAYTHLSKIDLPATLKKLGAGAFHYSFYMTGISVDEGNEMFLVDELYTENGTSYGVLYSRIADGKYQAEAYPGGNTAKTYTILEGTGRINEMAFTGANTLRSITCPVSLKTIGDKAFFDCAATTYTFLSYNAPTLEARYIDASQYSTDDWIYTVFSPSGEHADQRYYANFMYYAMYQYYDYYNFGLLLYYPGNGKGYDEFIWSVYFAESYYEADTIEDSTLAAIEAVQALPLLDEINSLTKEADQDAAKVRAEEITALLKEARTLYSRILSDTQIAFFTAGWDGTNYYEVLTAAEQAMRPVKDHFGIVTTVTGIELVSTPTKMSYVEGEKIDFTGLKLLVTYDDGTTAYVTDYTVSSDTASKASTRINVYYDNFSTYFRITVTAAPDVPVTPPDNPPGGGDSSIESSQDSQSSQSSAKPKGCKGGVSMGVIAIVALLPVCAYVVYRVMRKKSE